MSNLLLVHRCPTSLCVVCLGIFGCRFTAKNLTMLGLFGVALSKRRAEKNTAVRSKETTDVSNRLTILAKKKKKRIRELAYYVVFSSFSRIRPNPDGRPPGHGRNKRSTHPCASHRPEPAGTTSEAQEGSAIFWIFSMCQIYY